MSLEDVVYGRDICSIESLKKDMQTGGWLWLVSLMGLRILGERSIFEPENNI